MIPLEAVEAIVRTSVLDKWQTFDMVAEWAIESWGEFVSEAQMEEMWAKRVRVM